MKILHRILSLIVVFLFIFILAYNYYNDIKIAKLLAENNGITAFLVKEYFRKPLYILYEQSSLDVWKRINQNEDIKKRMGLYGKERETTKK